MLSQLNARQTADQVILIDLPADILFDFDKAALRPDAQPTLEKAARLIEAYERAPVLVAGHTDSVGDDRYNDQLASRRAQAVAGWLQTRIDRSMDVRGFGERQPVAPNTHPDGSDDPEGRQRNRRVEIRILPPPA